MRFRTLAALALSTIIPITGHAQILISEVAWMGTDADANNEWIELYNFSNTLTDLTGWTLVTDDGAISATLSGTLPPHGVGVLERTDDSTLPTVTALLTYTGALANTGTTITVKDAGGTVSDQAVGGTDWSGIGGNNTAPKKTAQRTMTGSWVTAAPTPGDQNAQTNDPVATTTNENNNTQTSSNTTKRSGGGGSSRQNSELGIKKDEPPVLALTINGPKTAYVNQEVTFEAMPSGVGTTLARSLVYDWNFGDTYTGTGKSTKHVFEYPGEYIVVVEGAFAKQRAMVRQEVKVLPVSFTLSKNQKGDVEVKNNATYETDLGGFTLRGGSAEFKFPKYTFVKANSTLMIPASRIGNSSSLALYDGQGVSVFSLNAGVLVPRSQVAVASKPQVVTETPAPEAPIVSAENTVIRIGEPTNTPRAEGFFGRFFTRIARIFGS